MRLIQAFLLFSAFLLAGCLSMGSKTETTCAASDINLAITSAGQSLDPKNYSSNADCNSISGNVTVDGQGREFSLHFDKLYTHLNSDDGYQGNIEGPFTYSEYTPSADYGGENTWYFQGSNSEANGSIDGSGLFQVSASMSNTEQTGDIGESRNIELSMKASLSHEQHQDD